MSGGRPVGQQGPLSDSSLYGPQDARAAYLVDSTLPELALSSAQSSAASPWSWFIIPGINEDPSTATPPPLPEGTIPSVNINDFKRYLASIGKNLEQFENSKGAAADVGESVHSGGNLTRRAASSSGATLTAISPSGLAQALVEVPLEYFQEDFTLNWGLIGPLDSIEKQQAVVDELSLQLDRIETHLTSEIAGRYDRFFEASIYIEQLQEDLKSLVDEVAERRLQTAQVAAEAKDASATARALQRQKRNLKSTLDLVTSVQEIVHAKAAMQNSLSAASFAGVDYPGALEVLHQLEGSCKGQVMNLAAVRGVPGYLTRVQAALKDIMVADVVERTRLNIEESAGAVLNTARSETNESVNGIAKGEGLLILAEKEKEIESSLRSPEAMTPLILSLCRINSLHEAVQAVQKDLHHGMAQLLLSLVKTFLVTSCNNIDPEDVSDDLEPIALSEALKKCSTEQYMRVLQLCVAAVKRYLQHSEELTDLLFSALEVASSTSTFETMKQHQVSKTDVFAIIKEFPHRAAQVAATYWGNLLTAWSMVATPNKLNLAQLGTVLDVTDLFASVTEVHLGKSVAILQGPIQQCCKAALDLMHASNVARLNGSLEVEKWAYAPISDSCANHLKAVGGNLVSLQSGDTDNESGNVSAMSTPTISIDGKSFHLTATTQVLFDVLHKNLEFAGAVPALLADTSQRVVELLRTFNSRTCQLILGAGAMQVSGLKSISVKHLAVACHSVRAVLAVFPALMIKFVEPVSLPRRTLILKEVERTSQDMMMHCSEINNKVIAIMCERLTPMHDFARILSASLGPSTTLPESPPPSGMAISTIKQLQILAEILTTTALLDDKETIMQQVLRNFVSVITAAYDDSELEVAGLREQAAADLEYVLNTIRRLSVSEKILEGCTQDMIALHLRKVSSIQAHKEAAAQLAVDDEPADDDQPVIEQQQEESLEEKSPSPPPPLPSLPEQVEVVQEKEVAEAEADVVAASVVVEDERIEAAADVEIPLD
ncbi:putative Vacuolar protein sorting-associated protein 54, chloroplastic [Nannochloris sp. 'desiccata']|nr:putative Vacuolar protein sorting-associated protein 54, chloroplastic [Chlorella desiccata (nom. nud.)]